MTRPERPVAAEWLALRRAADAAARDRAARLVTEWSSSAAGSGEPVTVFDVGAGTGANRAYLAPRLSFPARWVLLDHDAELLAAPGNRGARCVVGGIGELDRLVAAASGARLVTCSALLDLLTTAELDELAGVLARHRVAGLFSLSVDGSLRIDPQHPDDDAIAAAFNAHQSRDGRPGPRAAAHLAASCASLGLTVRRADSPWLLDAGSAPLVRRLLTERVGAAVEWRPQLGPAAEDWLTTRLTSLDDAALAVRVGHVELLVTPPG